MTELYTENYEGGALAHLRERAARVTPLLESPLALMTRHFREELRERGARLDARDPEEVGKLRRLLRRGRLAAKGTTERVKLR